MKRAIAVGALFLLPAGAFGQQTPPESWPARHPVLTGALVGAAAGVGAGVVIFEPSEWPGRDTGTMISAGIYAGIGALVGLAVGRSARVLKPGDTVRVTMADGSARSGRFVSLDGNQLSIEEGRAPAAIDLGSVATISRRGDSLKNGMLLGLLGGAGLGGVMGAVSHTKTGEVQTLEGIVAGATYGVGIGLLVDALHKGWTTSYRAARATSMSIVPYATPTRVGVTAQVTFGR